MLHFFALVLVAGAAFAEMQKYQPVEAMIAPGERIIIRGYKGDVTVTAGDGDALVVQGAKAKGASEFDQWNFKMLKSPGVVEIAVKGGSDMEDWDKIRAGQTPPYSIEVKAPSRPLEIAWQDGKIELVNWKNEATVNATRGSISSRGGQGSLFAQLIDGNILVKDHEGAVNLQTHKGEVSIISSKGPVLVDNHGASYRFSDHLGSLTLNNYQGRLTLAKVSGQMTFNNVNGTVSATEYQGSVRGDTTKGAVSIRATQIQDFVVNSDTGPVTLDLPKDAGAQVSVRSEKGRLWGPPDFVKRRRGRWTELRGKFKGKEPGQVKIVSKYGDIVVK